MMNLSVEQHNEVATSIVEFIREANRDAEATRRFNAPEAVRRRADTAAWHANRSAFIDGMRDAASSYDLAFSDHLQYGYGSLSIGGIGIELHAERNEVVRVAIGSYGNKTSHPRPKGGWNYLALVQKVLVRTKAKTAEQTERERKENILRSSEAACARVRAAAGLPDYAGSVKASTHEADRVIISVSKSLTEERAIRLLALIAAFDAEVL